MPQIYKSQRRELIRALVNAIHAIQWGFTYDFYDCALFYAPFRAIALEESDDAQADATTFDAIARMGLDAMQPTPTQETLFRVVSTPDASVDFDVAGFAIRGGYPMETMQTLCSILRNAIWVCRSSEILELDDVALMAHAVRDVATQQDTAAKAAFDSTVQSGFEGTTDPRFLKAIERRRHLQAFLSSNDPRNLPDFKSNWHIDAPPFVVEDTQPDAETEPEANASAMRAGWLYGSSRKDWLRC